MNHSSFFLKNNAMKDTYCSSIKEYFSTKEIPLEEETDANIIHLAKNEVNISSLIEHLYEYSIYYPQDTIIQIETSVSYSDDELFGKYQQCFEEESKKRVLPSVDSKNAKKKQKVYSIKEENDKNTSEFGITTNSLRSNSGSGSNKSFHTAYMYVHLLCSIRMLVILFDLYYPLLLISWILIIY